MPINLIVSPTYRSSFGSAFAIALQFRDESNRMNTEQLDEASFSQASRRVKKTPKKSIKKQSVETFYDDNILKNEDIGLRSPETSFENFFRLNVQLLAGLRLFSADFSLSGKIVNTKKRNALPVFIEVGQLVFLTICQIRSFFMMWSTDPDFAVTIFTGMLPGILCTFKGVRIWLCQVELRELMINLAILWEKSRFQANVQHNTLKIAKRTSYVRSWYLAMVIFIAISYGMRPCLLLLQFKVNHEINETYDYSVTGLPTIYPFLINTLTKYLACIIWEMIIGLLLVLYWAACDTLFAQLVSHTSIQFQVLQCDLKSIGSKTEINSAEDEKTLLRKLQSIAKRHNDLFTHCKTIEAIYNPIIFVTMVSTAVTMCFCVLSVEREMKRGNHEEVVKNVAHFITVVGQSIIYCGYADDLTNQSLLITQAAYQCQWIKRDKNFKINLQIIMMRAQKHCYLTGYGFFHLTLNQITVIVNTALSYFTILRSMT